MLKRLLTLVLLPLASFTTVVPSHPQKATGTIGFQFDNDTFAFSDAGYTGGLKLYWMSSFKSARWWKGFPFLGRSGSRHAVSLALSQKGYTPHDLARSDLIAEDRPYAGFLHFDLGMHSRDDRRMQSIEVFLGIVGPHAYAAETQRLFHRWLGQIEPAGWDHQLGDELALGINCEHVWRLRKGNPHGWGIEWLPRVGGGVGNVHTFGHAGLQIRGGWKLPDDFGIHFIRPSGDRGVAYREKSRFNIQAYAAVDAKVVLRDIFLDGNTLLDSHRVEKHPLVGDLILGIALQSGGFQISYAYVLWSKRFRTEPQSQIFGSLSLTYTY
jgi:hypothetical protein